MKSIRPKHLILLLLVPMLLTAIESCKRTLSNDEIMGKRIVSAPAGFTGMKNGDPVDLRLNYQVAVPASIQNKPYDPLNPPNPFEFGRDDGLSIKGDRLYFNNTLSHEVTWSIKLKGLSSGAQKTYNGTGNSIDSNYVFIDGSTDGAHFFLKGELITYSISFLGSSIKYEGNLITLDNVPNGPKRYDGFVQKRAGAAPIKYVCVDDMEPSGYSKGGQGIRVSYRDAADNNNAIFYTIADKQVDGHFAFYMKGTDLNRNTYCGGFGGESLTELYDIVPGYESDPSKVYLNAYVYGYGRPNSALNVLLFEDDSWVPSTLPHPAVRPDITKNDMWLSIIQVDWVGWKLVSIPYSSFRTANNPNSGGNGNRIREPHKLAGMGMELDSYPVAGSTVELALDVVYITTNGAFQP